MAEEPIPSPDPTPAPEPTPEPVLLAGKYKSADDLAKGYKELETKLGTQGTEIEQLRKKLNEPRPPDPSAPAPASDPSPLDIPEPTPAPDPGATPPPASHTSLKDITVTAGLDPEVIGKTWVENKGKLTDEQYASYEKQGVNRGVVNEILRLQQAELTLQQMTEERIATQCQSMAGGETQLKTLMQFAGTFDEGTKADLRVRIKDPSKFKGAMHQIATAYNEHIEAEGGSAITIGRPTTLTPSSTGGIPFKSKQEQYDATKALRAQGVDPLKDEGHLARLRATPANIK